MELLNVITFKSLNIAWSEKENVVFYLNGKITTDCTF